MSLMNEYEKHYLTSRRTTNDHHIYVLILFKADNTFSIKKKSNLHGVDENGLVTIKDRGKTYVGYCLLEGSLAEIEDAAARLDKQMNTDIESDCEAVISNTKVNKQRSYQLSTSAPTTNSSIQIGRPSATKVNDYRKKKDTNDAQQTMHSLGLIHLDHTLQTYDTPPPIDVSAKNKATRQTLPTEDSGTSTLHDIQNTMKNNPNKVQTRPISTFDETGSEDEHDSEDDQALEKIIGLDNSSQLRATIAHKGSSRSSKRPLLDAITTNLCQKSLKRFCDKTSPSDVDNNEVIILLKSSLLSNCDLNKDVKRLLVSIDKLDAKIDILFENQRKMQRALAKRKIGVSLNATHFGGAEESEGDGPFLSTLVYKHQNGDSVDLIQLYGVRNQLGRYAALTMDHLFTKEELTSIDKDQLVKDERYQIIKEAVRSRFQLNKETLISEWPSVHESILQKRRNEIKKRRNAIHNQNKSGQSVIQEIEQDYNNQKDMSNTF